MKETLIPVILNHPDSLEACRAELVSASGQKIMKQVWNDIINRTSFGKR